MKRLAHELNCELKKLRVQKQKYQNGDKELKGAVTNISHDLRTPLTAICGYMDLLEREEKSENVSRYLGFVQNRIEAMKQLTEELFRYSVILSTEEDMELVLWCVNRTWDRACDTNHGATNGTYVE